MQHRNRFFPLFLLFSMALAAPAGAQSKAQAPQDKTRQPQAQEDNPYVKRFKELDRNGNGSVERDEWPLAPASFDIVDVDKDGRLSANELLRPNATRRDRLEGQLGALDTNHDGILSEAEWQRGGAGYGGLDTNRDGRISRPEYERLVPGNPNVWRPSATLPEQRVFRNLDRNRDNRVTSREWTGGRVQFNRLDRNRDGVISPNEWPRR